MDTIELLVGVVVLLALVVAVAAWMKRRNAGGENLQARFGMEYDNVLAESDTPEEAERELRARIRRVRKLRIRELNQAQRQSFVQSWEDLQTSFVDDPIGAVVLADQLLNQVMRARRYPTDDFEQAVKDLSVDHAHVVQHYRAAKALADANHKQTADTEELRQAVVHYRALFAELVETTIANPVALEEIRV